MAYYNDSSAYKFELFENKKERTEPQIKVIQNKEADKARNREFMLKMAAYVAVFFVGIISILYSQISLTEVTEKVSTKTSELEKLENEYRMLTTEMESSVALSNIQTIITRDLGMTKLNDDQVTYVNLSEGDVMTLPEGSDGNIFTKIWNSFTQGE